MRKLGGMALAIAVGCIASTSQATTLTTGTDYAVTSAESERARRDVALSLFSGDPMNRTYDLGSGFRGIFYFEDAGTMQSLPNDEWSITGRVIADDWENLDPNQLSGFDISLSYDQAIDFAVQFKSEEGAPGQGWSTEQGNETYLNMASGMLTGFGALAGLDMTLTRMPANGPYATQIGGGLTSELGANNHNSNFGIANWFFVDEVTSATCGICIGNDAITNLSGGDLNADLNELAAVPVPAAGLLMLTGLLGFGAMRRRS